MPFWTTGTITRTFGTPRYRVCAAEPGRRSQLGAPYWYKVYDTTNWPNSLLYNEDRMSWYEPNYTYAPTPLGTEWCL